MILLDASGLLAALHDRQSGHRESLDSLEQSEPPLILSPFVLAELDYMIGERIDERARLALLAEVKRGAYRLEAFSSTDVAAALAVIQHYADLRLSLADASIVILSERYGVNDVLTLDERHFRVLHGAHGLPFRVLPADS